MGHFGSHFGGHFDVPREIRKVVENKELTLNEKVDQIHNLVITNSEKIDNSWKNWKALGVGLCLGVLASSIASLIIINFYNAVE